MLIKFSPQRRDDSVVYEKRGECVVVNGEVFDFSRMGNGDTLPVQAITSQWFDGDVDKIEGVLHITLLLPNPANYSPEQAFPTPITVDTDGIIKQPEPLPTVVATIESEVVDE